MCSVSNTPSTALPRGTPMPHEGADFPPQPAASPPLGGAASQSQNSRTFNLTFHGVGDPPSAIGDITAESHYWLTTDAFECVLDRAKDWPDARITFDDGNLSDLTLALPRLLKRNLNASFFIVAARVGTPGYLGPADLRTLLSAGMNIGSHGMQHRPWRRLPPADLQHEIQGAKARLEDLLGIPITQAACPFGAYDRLALRTLAAAGFTRVFTSDRGWASSATWFQPRNTITASTQLHDLDRVRSWSWPRRCAHQLKLALKRCR